MSDLYGVTFSESSSLWNLKKGEKFATKIQKIESQKMGLRARGKEEKFVTCAERVYYWHFEQASTAQGKIGKRGRKK